MKTSPTLGGGHPRPSAHAVAVVTAFFAIVLTGCVGGTLGVGDPGGQAVDFHNASAAPVHVYEVMSSKTPGRRLAPGETWKNAWLIPPPSEQERRSASAN